MATSVYFDASLLVSLFVIDGFADRARIFIQDRGPTPVVSDFAAAEFASEGDFALSLGFIGKQP